MGEILIKYVDYYVLPVIVKIYDDGYVKIRTKGCGFKNKNISRTRKIWKMKSIIVHDSFFSDRDIYQIPLLLGHFPAEGRTFFAHTEKFKTLFLSHFFALKILQL